MKIPTVLLTTTVASTLSLAPMTRAEPLANTKKRAQVAALMQTRARVISPSAR